MQIIGALGYLSKIGVEVAHRIRADAGLQLTFRMGIGVGWWL